MEAPKKPAGNGTLDEYGNRLPKPDNLSKWESFKVAIWNPTEKTFLGRDKKRWGIFALFYLVFYTGLAILCAICGIVLNATLDDDKPTYTLESSLIGTNPGLGFLPRPIIEDGALISYTASNSSHVKKWVANLDEALEKYLNKSKLPYAGRTQMICDYNQPPEPGKVCYVDPAAWGNCNSAQSYGFNNSAPCVFVKLNRIYDWVPDFYNDPENLPEQMPDDLKNAIRKTEKSKRNTIWISCNGETARDREAIGPLEYYPRGLPGFYYPYTNQREYLSPLVAVHFLRPKRNVTINIECKAWAKNIHYHSRRGEKIGAVHLELMIKE